MLCFFSPPPPLVSLSRSSLCLLCRHRCTSWTSGLPVFFRSLLYSSSEFVSTLFLSPCLPSGLLASCGVLLLCWSMSWTYNATDRTSEQQPCAPLGARGSARAAQIHLLRFFSSFMFSMFPSVLVLNSRIYPLRVFCIYIYISHFSFQSFSGFHV